MNKEARDIIYATIVMQLYTERYPLARRVPLRVLTVGHLSLTFPGIQIAMPPLTVLPYHLLPLQPRFMLLD